MLYCGGGQEVWDLAENKLTMYGRFVLEAVPPKVGERFEVTPFKFLEKQMTYTGVSGYSAAQYQVAMEMIQKKIVKTDPIITHSFSLDEYAKAFEYAEKRKDGAIKVIINKF
jgi:L-iditol 2-dehydrogenase